MRSHEEVKKPPTAVSVASTPNSDITASEAPSPHLIDGYMSDPGVDISYFEEKNEQRKRKSNVLATLSRNVKYRRIERSIHLQ
jgi:hypothetical protein